MAKTTVGTAHRHKDSRGKWVTDELPHTHDYTETRYPADTFTDGEVIRIKAFLGQVVPAPTPEPAPAPAPEPVPTPPPSTTNPSGQAMPVGHIAGWDQIFADDFTTALAEGQWPQGNAAVDAKWDFYPSAWDDTSNNGWYGNQGISTHDSVLDMHLRWLNNRWQVAAPIPVPPGGTVRTNYRIAVRFKADPVVGFKTAWLLWPSSNVWPRDGEIDFPEGGLASLIEAYMHRQNATSGGDQDYRGSGKPFSDWHTAVIEWVAGQSCRFELDGVQLGSVITSRVPNTPMRYVVQTETRLDGLGPPPAGAQAHVLLDWIAIYAKV